MQVTSILIILSVLYFNSVLRTVNVHISTNVYYYNIKYNNIYLKITMDPDTYKLRYKIVLEMSYLFITCNVLHPKLVFLFYLYILLLDI